MFRSEIMKSEALRPKNRKSEPICFKINIRINPEMLFVLTLRRLIIVPGGLITSPWVVLVVLVLVFVSTSLV